MSRKYLKPKFQLDVADNLEIKAQCLNQFLKQKSTKRPEECYKFVLTRVFKYLRRHLTQQNVILGKDEDLYAYYFDKVASELGFPLTAFHYPLTGSKQKFKLNSCYFARIFRSRAFVEEIAGYVKERIYEEYSENIKKKFCFLLTKWNTDLVHAPSRDASVEKSIINYILFHKRCKLPWSFNEIREAVARF